MSVSAPDPTSVYLYYDAHGLLIYVGITRRGITRNVEHNTSKDWWQLVTRQEVEHYPTREEAHAREVDLIRGFLPPFNVQHNPHHAEIRAGYQKIADAPTTYPEALELVKTLRRRLPLVPVQETIDSPRLLLRTSLEHRAIASRLTWVDRVPVNGPGKAGMLTGIQITGGMAVLTVERRGRFDIHSAWAPVRALTNVKPQRFFLSGLTLVTPELAARASARTELI